MVGSLAAELGEGAAGVVGDDATAEKAVGIAAAVQEKVMAMVPEIATPEEIAPPAFEAPPIDVPAPEAFTPPPVAVPPPAVVPPPMFEEEPMRAMVRAPVEPMAAAPSPADQIPWAAFAAAFTVFPALVIGFSEGTKPKAPGSDEPGVDGKSADQIFMSALSNLAEKPAGWIFGDSSPLYSNEPPPASPAPPASPPAEEVATYDAADLAKAVNEKVEEEAAKAKEEEAKEEEAKAVEEEAVEEEAVEEAAVEAKVEEEAVEAEAEEAAEEAKADEEMVADIVEALKEPIAEADTQVS